MAASDLSDALDRALRMRLLEERGDGYAFRHPVVRSACTTACRGTAVMSCMPPWPSGHIHLIRARSSGPGRDGKPESVSTSASPSPTSASPSPPPSSSPGAPVGTDSFQRANQALWGTASDGQVWGGDANTQGVFSIKGNAGVVSNTAGNSYSAVLGPAVSNAEVVATGSMSAFSNSNLGTVLRWTDGNNWYKAFIDGANLVVQKKVAGSTTVLATAPFAAAAGTAYTIHFRVMGSTLTANAWAASGSEPSGWMITTTDTALTSGRCGLRFLTQGGTATITAYQADSV